MEEREEDGSRCDVNSTSEKRDSLGLEVARESLKRGVVAAVMVEVEGALDSLSPPVVVLVVFEDVEVTGRRRSWFDDVEGGSGALEEWSV